MKRVKEKERERERKSKGKKKTEKQKEKKQQKEKTEQKQNPTTHDIRQRHDAPLAQDLVPGRRRRRVGRLDQELAPERLGRRRVDHGGHRGRNEHVARQLEDLLERQRFPAGEGPQRPSKGRRGPRVPPQRRDVEPARGVRRAVPVRDGDHPRAGLVEDLGGPASDVAEPLDDDGFALEPSRAVGSEELARGDDDAPARGALPAVRAVQGQGLYFLCVVLYEGERRRREVKSG